MRLPLGIAALVIGVSAVLSTRSATAGELYVYGFGHPYLGGGLGNVYASGRVPTPPYFALHPPVYYSAPVPRAYGHSPFAHLPQIARQPEVVVPLEMENPYVPRDNNDGPPAEPTGRTAAVPKMMYNPYVNESPTAGFVRATQEEE